MNAGTTKSPHQAGEKGGWGLGGFGVRSRALLHGRAASTARQRRTGVVDAPLDVRPDVACAPKVADDLRVRIPKVSVYADSTHVVLGFRHIARVGQSAREGQRTGIRANIMFGLTRHTNEHTFSQSNEQHPNGPHSRKGGGIA